MHEIQVNRLGGLSLPRKSVVRLVDRPDMTLDVYRGRKTTQQQQQRFDKRMPNIPTAILMHLCTEGGQTLGTMAYMLLALYPGKW